MKRYDRGKKDGIKKRKYRCWKIMQILSHKNKIALIPFYYKKYFW